MSELVVGHIFMRGPYPREEFDVYVWLGKIFVKSSAPWPYSGETRYTLHAVPLLDDNFYIPVASGRPLPHFNGYRHDQILTAPAPLWTRAL